MNSKQFAKAIIGGGITIKNGDVADYDYGYMVSMEGYEAKVPLEKLGLDIIHEYERECQEVLEENHFGMWIEGDVAYLDVSIHVKSLEEALKIARKNNQKSIYDIDKDEVIYL